MPRSSTKKTSASANAPSAKAAPVEPTPVVQESQTNETETLDSFDSVHAVLRARLATIERVVRECRSLFKKAEQFYRRDQRAAQQALRNGKRRRRERDPNAPKRSPSGIAKPTVISAELAKFLNVAPSTMMARTDVIKKIANYIKTNNLENPKNRRQIQPDKALSKLLSVSKTDQVTYFNLQRFMSPHFPKSAAALALSQKN